MATNETKIVTKKGNVLTASEYHNWTRKQLEVSKAERMRKYSIVRKIYWDYLYDGISDKDARGLLKSQHKFHGKVINGALNTGTMNAVASVEFAAKALVLQEREESALNSEIETIDMLITEALESNKDKRYTLKGKSNSRDTDEDWITRDEYIIRLEQRKRKAIKDTIDSLRVFKSDNTEVKVIVTQEEHADRMRKSAERFGIEIKSNYKVRNSD